MSESDTAVETLRRGMLGKQFYLIFMRVVEPMENPRDEYFGKHRETFDAHTKWLHDIEQNGIMFASGPLRDETAWDGSGMAIIRANSREDAEQIAASEPFHQAGIRKNSVEGWTMNEGSFTIDVKFMSQEAGLS
tara:strand:+ start:3525 stop:3926 length:402 start_codon:yes stop_codon:yes gene_type:complete